MANPRTRSLPPASLRFVEKLGFPAFSSYRIRASPFRAPERSPFLLLCVVLPVKPPPARSCRSFDEIGHTFRTDLPFARLRTKELKDLDENTRKGAEEEEATSATSNPKTTKELETLDTDARSPPRSPDRSLYCSKQGPRPSLRPMSRCHARSTCLRDLQTGPSRFSLGAFLPGSVRARGLSPTCTVFLASVISGVRVN